MTKYRYLFCDLLTNAVTIELPLYGTYFERIVGREGNATYTIQLGAEQLDDDEIINGTRPGRTKLFVERNGQLVWGGINWSRTWQEISSTFQYTGQTAESFFLKQFIEETLTFTDVDQRNIAIQLINHMQAKTGADIGLIVPDEYAVAGIVRTVQFNDYEGWSYGKALNHLASFDDGIELTVDPAWSPDGTPGLYVRVDDQLGLPADAFNVPTFDYPGNIRNFWYPENASRGAVSTLGFGKGEGTSMKRSKYTDAALLADGYPDIQRAYDNKDVSDQATLDSQTLAAGRATSVPIVTPTFELDPEGDAPLGSWSLGDYIKIHIESRRFPNAIDVSTRAMGFTLRPAEDSAEQIGLVVPEGEEIVDG